MKHGLLEAVHGGMYSPRGSISLCTCFGLLITSHLLAFTNINYTPYQAYTESTSNPYRSHCYTMVLPFLQNTANSVPVSMWVSSVFT